MCVFAIAFSGFPLMAEAELSFTRPKLTAKVFGWLRASRDKIGNLAIPDAKLRRYHQ